MYVDPQIIVSRSLGTDQMRRERAFQMLTDPRVQPFIDMEAVVDKFILEEYSDGDPDQFKAKQSPNDMMGAMMGGKVEGPMPSPTQGIINQPVVAS